MGERYNAGRSNGVFVSICVHMASMCERECVYIVSVCAHLCVCSSNVELDLLEERE